MPFKATHKEQIKLLTKPNFNIAGIVNCESIVRNVLSQSPYLDKERAERISIAVGNKSRVLENIINTISK